MKPKIYIAKNELTSPKFGQAFAEGCDGVIVRQYVRGKDNIERPRYIPGPWAGFGSPQVWKSLNRAIKGGMDFYYGDHAYFGRGKYYRVTKNRYQHDGRIGDIAPDHMNRFKQFQIPVKPWKKDGKHIIVCPQSKNHHERFGEEDWQDRVMKTLEFKTDRPIIVRTKKSQRPLLADLEGAHCVITHTSQSAVEAILFGVPAICTGDCVASIMSSSDPVNVEMPYYPEGRAEWAGVQANNQWTLDEIASGKCWEHVQ